MTSEEVVLQVKSIYERLKDEYDESFSCSERNLSYVLQKQWDDSHIKRLNILKKAALTYNILMPTLNTLLGNEQLSQRKMVFKPQSANDINIVDIMNKRWEMLRNEQDLQRTEYEAFLDALIHNHGGHIEYNIGIDKYGDTEIYFERGDPFNIMYEPNCQKYDLSDCNYLVKYTWMTLDEMTTLFGDFNSLDENKIPLWQKITNFVSGLTRSRNAEFYDKDNGRYLLIELQKKERVKTLYGKYNDNYVNISEKELQIIEKNGKFETIRESNSIRIRKQIVAPYFENVVLYNDIVPYLTNFNIIPVHSFSLCSNIQERVSLIEMLIDPQDDINKAKSQHADHRKDISGKLITYKKGDQDIADALNSQRGDSTITVPVRNQDDVQIKPINNNIDQNILMTADSSKYYADNISQITSAMQGRSERSGESNALYQNKVAMGSVSVNQYYDNLSRSRKLMMRAFADLFPFVYYQEERILRLLDENGNPEKTVVNIDGKSGIYNDVRLEDDVIIAEINTSLTMREEMFNKILMMMQTMASVGSPELGTLLIPALLRNTEIEDRDKIISRTEEMMQNKQALNNEQNTLNMADQILGQQNMMNTQNQ